MGKNSRPLTDPFVKNVKPESRPRKYYDGGGLHLLVKIDGNKYWHLDYRYNGKAKMFALGVYPETTLAEARKGRESAKAVLAEGKDPMIERKAERLAATVRAENSFEALAKEWLDQRSWTEKHGLKTWQSFKNDILPAIGQRPITDVTPPEVLALLRKIEARGVRDLPQRALQRINSVFRYAIQTGRATYNPGQDMKGAMKVWKKQARPALMADDLPEFFEKLNGDPCYEMTKLGLLLVVLTWLRSAELRGGLWCEVNFDKREWIIPAARMKMKDRPDHLIPLSPLAVKVLARLKELAGKSPFIFPGRNNPQKVMSENTMTYALYGMGYRNKATVHGFRATASTIVNESGLFLPDAIERQLAHAEKDLIRAAYHRAEYLEERRRMMDWWGAYIEALISPMVEGGFNGDSTRVLAVPSNHANSRQIP